MNKHFEPYGHYVINFGSKKGERIILAPKHADELNQGRSIKAYVGLFSQEVHLDPEDLDAVNVAVGKPGSDYGMDLIRRMATESHDEDEISRLDKLMPDRSEVPRGSIAMPDVSALRQEMNSAVSVGCTQDTKPSAGQVYSGQGEWIDLPYVPASAILVPNRKKHKHKLVVMRVGKPVRF